MDGRYSVTIQKLTESVETSSCDSCAIILKATQQIKNEFDLDFRNAVLDYVDKDGQQGLSLTLTMLHPLHTKPGDWEKAQESRDLKTSVHTGPNSKTSKRQWEYKIVSPMYEIFVTQVQNTERASPSMESNLKGRPMCESWTSILQRPSRCGDSGGGDAIEWTQSNLIKCSSSHAACNEKSTKVALPSRVLDLGENTGIELTADVKLYLSDREEKPYLSLSHCWGTDRASMPLETTRENLAEFQRGISWKKLTKTFQDAVVFTRKLGYRYLWIDSLCIIQNDKEDWMREAGEMASIYENAVLTLAAASSSDSNGGLFRSSIPSIPLSDIHDAQQICLRRFADPTFFQYQPKGQDSDVNDVSPLIRRAWVFQERMLSRRVLFFTPLELVFECRTSSNTESGYSWIDSTTKRAFTLADKREDADAELGCQWRNLVNDFTQLQLTMYWDTLPAMAGLAKKFQLMRRIDANSYFSGLWKQTFIEDMLWETPRWAVRRRETTNSGIPTWSWARSREPKRYDNYRDLRPLSRLEKAICKVGGQAGNAFTSVDDGYAIISGYVLKAKATSGGLVIDQNPRVSHSPLKDYDWFEDGPHQINMGDELSILPLASSTNGEGDAHVHSLVLRPCGDDENTFVRVGIFQPSVYHLRGHEYIFEGTDALLSIYRHDVKYGESLLGKNGLYRGSEEHSDKPRYLTSTMDKAYKDFKSRAWFLYLCLNGQFTESEEQKFFGLPHLETIKNRLNSEEERVQRWNCQNGDQDDELHERIRVKLM